MGGCSRRSSREEIERQLLEEFLIVFELVGSLERGKKKKHTGIMYH
jgi:hypothetical protein